MRQEEFLRELKEENVFPYFKNILNDISIKIGLQQFLNDVEKHPTNSFETYVGADLKRLFINIGKRKLPLALLVDAVLWRNTDYEKEYEEIHHKYIKGNSYISLYSRTTWDDK